MRGRVFVRASDNIYNRVQWPPPRSDCLQTQRPLYTPSQHTHLLWQCTTFFSVIPNEEFQLMLQLIFTTMGSTLLPLPIPWIKISTCPGLQLKGYLHNTDSAWLVCLGCRVMSGHPRWHVKCYGRSYQECHHCHSWHIGCEWESCPIIALLALTDRDPGLQIYLVKWYSR